MLTPQSVGQPDVDRVIAATLNLLDAVAPGRLVAAYVKGSWATGQAVPTSDVDLLLVHDATPDERERLHRAARWAAELALTLDPGLYPTDRLDGWILGDHARLVWGRELRPVPPPDRDRYVADRMHGAWGMCIRGRAHLGRRVDRLPLDWPDPAGALRGYDFRTLPDASGREVPSTKELVVASGWIATAELALLGVVVETKSDCVRLYAEHVGGEAAGWLADLHAVVRERHAYRVPDALEEIQALLPGMLAFENAFATRYVAWCRGRPDDPRALRALADLEGAPLVP